MQRAPIPTIIISHQHPYINNFDVLPAVMHIGDVRVIRLNHHNAMEAEVSYTDGHLQGSVFDLLITDEVVTPVGRTEKVPTVSLPRLTKIKQARRINTAVQEMGKEKISHFTPIKSFLLSDASALGCFEGTPRIVVKHEHGARGLGQIVVDLNLIGYDKARHLLFKLKQAADSSDGVEKVAEVIEQSKGAFLISKGHEKYDGEYLDYLKDISVVQGLIEDVQTEYRLLTDLEGNIVWAQERDLEGDVFKTATGSNGNTQYLHLPENTLMADNQVVFNEVQALLKYMGISLNSVDLFITKEGQWGIFEFCNQWGIQGVNAGWAKEYQTRAMTDILKAHGLI